MYYVSNIVDNCMNTNASWWTEFPYNGLNRTYTTSITLDSNVSPKIDIEKLRHLVDTQLDRKDLIKLPSYPHSNCWVNESSELVLQFALAGYKKEQISVEVSKTNELTLKVKASKEDSQIVYLHRKISNKDIEMNLILDKVYDLENSKVNYIDGLLEIVIPRSIDASVKKLM